MVSGDRPWGPDNQGWMLCYCIAHMNHFARRNSHLTSVTSQLVLFPPSSAMTHKKAQKRKATDPPQNHVAFRNSTVKRVHYTTTDDAGSSTSTSIRGRIPITQLTANVAQQKDAESRCLPDPELDDTPEQSKRTQVSLNDAKELSN